MTEEDEYLYLPEEEVAQERPLTDAPKEKINYDKARRLASEVEDVRSMPMPAVAAEVYRVSKPAELCSLVAVFSAFAISLFPFVAEIFGVFSYIIVAGFLAFFLFNFQKFRQMNNYLKQKYRF